MAARKQQGNDYFAPRDGGGLLAALRSSRRVAVLRVALPAAALLALAAVIFWPAEGRRIIVMPPMPVTPQLAMDQPRFSGTDEQNRPYVLKAQRAVQLPDNLMQVDLVAPEARMAMPDGRPMAGSATVGRFDQTKKRLWLGGAVAMTQGGGPDGDMHFTTSELFADFGSRTVWGDRPARLSGAFGTIEGQGFRIFDGGKTLLFTGQSRAILNGEGGLAMPAQIIENKR